MDIAMLKYDEKNEKSRKCKRGFCGKWIQKTGKLILAMVLPLLLSGCGTVNDRTEKIADLEYTVLSPDEFPKELTDTLEQKKTEPFRMTYADKGYLYICIGYGQQQTGGYSITVDELYETTNGIYVDTTLTGPGPEEEISDTPSYPFIVLKLEDIGKSVIFG